MNAEEHIAEAIKASERIEESRQWMATHAKYRASAIRQAHRLGMSAVDIAERLGVTRQSVYRIIDNAEEEK